MAKEVRNYFEGKVFGDVIPRNRRLTEAHTHGNAALLYDISSRGAESYLELTQEILYS